MAVRTESEVARTAFVLAGGASLAAMQVGMLRALYERGVRADLLVATSAGALNAAFLASRPQTVETAKELADVWRGLHRQDVFPIHPPTVIAALTNQRDHLVPDRALRRLAASHLEIDLLEDARTPLPLVAFDVLSGEEVPLSGGPAIDAVLAAAAIPGGYNRSAGGAGCSSTAAWSTTPRSHARSSSVPSAYTSCPRRIPRCAGCPLHPGARSTRPSTPSCCSSTPACRAISPATRRRRS